MKKMNKITLNMLDSEVWYGPSTNYGLKSPHTKESEYNIDIEDKGSCNQDNPFLVSNMGRYVFAPKGFKLKIQGGTINVESRYGDIYYSEEKKNLREAILDAKIKYFTPNGVCPPEEFFTIPQYNTWIELIHNQNQEDVLKYAHGIVDNGMPAGIIMIDDGWNDYYGSFDFSLKKFPNPKSMCDELHSMGFKVMLWTCPFISPDSPEFRELEIKNYMVKTLSQAGSAQKCAVPAIREWWNGWSAIIDFTNPDARKWVKEKLDYIMEEYGVDGFKFDAGDPVYYRADDITYEQTSPSGQSLAWNLFGLNYAFNEFRACFGCAGLHLVQRLQDKSHSWGKGVAALVPDSIIQSVMGYSYTCPDMIGGGNNSDFVPGSSTFDSELLVRYCQTATLMPMMQFSLAPWRVLDKEQYNIILECVKLHKKFSSKIIGLAKEASNTGEPILRSLEYVFPHQGFEKVMDIFMLGNDILVAPVYKKGERVRELILPNGKWKYEDGTIYNGGPVKVNAPLEKLPYFEKID